MYLSPDDQYHLNAAAGYLDLGMFKDSQAELEKVAPDALGRPESLAVRLALYQETKSWAAMQVVAKKLVELDPTAPHWAIAWAYATRRAESIEQAKVILTDALDRHRTEPLIHYNLACYDCQMGKIPSAKQFIATALRLAPGMRPMALSDEDLKPLWASL